MIYVYQCVARLCSAHVEGWVHATSRLLDQPPRCPRCGEAAALLKVIQGGGVPERRLTLRTDARARVAMSTVGA